MSTTNLPEVLDFRKDILPLSGALRFPLTHDYMFTSSFQYNTYALKGFLAAKLNIAPEDITSLEILNPLQHGTHADDKDIVLDIEVCLNQKTLIDIEMQVAHYDYLPERFLHQLCRIYSESLPKGKDYTQIPPVIHIAITDCDLFPKGDPRNTEDFLSEYYLTNTENYQKYTGNFHMEVISLKYIENAKDKNDPNGIYQWARLLKATTWEEFNMIAENNTYMESLATNVCVLCNDPQFVRECNRRLRNEWEYNSRMAEADRKGMKRGLERGTKLGMERGTKIGMERGLEEGTKIGIEQGIEQGIERGIEAFIKDGLEEGRDKEITLKKLRKLFSLSEEEAEKYYKRYAV